MTRTLAAAPSGFNEKVNPDRFPKDGPEAHRWLREKIEAASGPGREAYVLLRTGAWGRFQWVLTYDPASRTVIIHQNLQRQRAKNFPSAAPTPVGQ